MPDEAREVFVYSDDFKTPSAGNFRPTIKPADAPDFEEDAPSLEGSIDQEDPGAAEGKDPAPVELQPVNLDFSPDLAGTARTATKQQENS